MTIQLTKSVWIAGVVRAPGYQVTFTDSDEALFVSSGLATYVTRNPSIKDVAVTSIVRDTAGRITSFVDDGVPVVLTYDGSGRVETVTRAAVVETITYDASGNVAQIIRGLP